MKRNHKSGKEDLARGDFLLRNRRRGEQTSLRTFGELRHTTQLNGIREVDKIEEDEKILLFSKFQKGVFFPGGSSGPSYCCLFNLIVAFDWNPGFYELELLRNTCDEAANLLFDVTDGYMTFDRIIVGGPELMKCADLQIFASNRLFPRAWVNGLHIEEKYQPIRIGRGYWRKNDRRADPWHKNLGAAVLVHEWLHYAVGLKDDYVKEQDGYALPTASPSVNTLMANLESDELLGLNESPKHNEWEQLHKNPSFEWLGIPDKRKSQNIPPDESPAPRFHMIGTAKEDRQDEPQVWLNWEEASLGDLIARDHCWVFVFTSKNPQSPLTTLNRLIAQGSYEDLPGGYRIIGAKEDAFILLIGHAPDEPSTPKVFYSQITDISGSVIKSRPTDWQPITPTDSQIPLVAVSIPDEQIAPPYEIRIDGQAGGDWKPILFPLGEQQASRNNTVEALDGHVLLLRSNNGGNYELAIANYSIGGSPSAAYPANPNPVPAGSSDGNAMIFFYSEKAKLLRGKPAEQPDTLGASLQRIIDEARLLEKQPAGQLDALGASLQRIIDEARLLEEQPVEEVLEASELRIITTTNLLAPPGKIGHGPRSYAFAVTSNKTLPTDNGKPNFNPTLVLYFDADTKKEHKDATLKIYRLSESGWQPVKEDDQQEDSDRKLVAARLNKESAPGLFKNPPEPEYYRLFLV